MPISNIASGMNAVLRPDRQGGSAERRDGGAAEAAGPPGSGRPHSAVSQEALRAALSALDVGVINNRKLQFELDHRSGGILVKVVDADTGEVIRVVPLDELRPLHRGAREGDTPILSALA